MIKTFISHSHSENQNEKEKLAKLINSNSKLEDKSVNIGEINDNLTDEQIRIKIRDFYLKDTTVTIVLVGKNAPNRKHIDWEIYSSMYDGSTNSQSGIVVIDMISDRKHTGYKDIRQYFDDNWICLKELELKNKFYNFPLRIVDNLVNKESHITVIPYQKILENNNILFDAIELAHINKTKQKYDLSKPMRRKNNNIPIIEV